MPARGSALPGVPGTGGHGAARTGPCGRCWAAGEGAERCWGLGQGREGRGRARGSQSPRSGGTQHPQPPGSVGIRDIRRSFAHIHAPLMHAAHVNSCLVTFARPITPVYH